MKFKNLLKSLPFLSTLILVIFFNIFNQKDSAKLKILIWNTPSLSVGSYIAISTASGFIISYIFTNRIANINKAKSIGEKDYVDTIQSEESNKFINNKNINSRQKILIERDIRDPSPTFNADFRIIGKTNNSGDTFKNIYQQEYDRSDSPDQSNEIFNDNPNKAKRSKEINSKSNDWVDNSFLNW